VNPEERIKAYLQTKKSVIEHMTVDQAVKQVKLNVFYGMSPISEDEIRKVIRDWAMIYAVGMLVGPVTGGGDPTGAIGPVYNPKTDSELIDSVKKAFGTVIDGVKLGKENKNVTIAVTGLTGNLKKGNQSVALGLSWTGTLSLEAAAGPFNFAGELATDKWSVSLSFPQDTFVPDLSRLSKVFSEGEKSMHNLAAATAKFKNISDVRSISALVKPDIAAVQEAADALASVAKAPKGGGVSFGFKIGSPDPVANQEGMPKGYQGTVVFTYRW
jgi:hypothetical protein